MTSYSAEKEKYGMVKDVGSKAELEDTINGESTVIIHFRASCCEASLKMDKVFVHLAIDFPHVLFVRVKAEEVPELSEAYSIPTVPYFILCKDGKTVDTMEDADPTKLAYKVMGIAGPAASFADLASPFLEKAKDLLKENGSLHSELSNSSLTNESKVRLQQLVNSHPVFLFMKGTPKQPKCEFSRKVVHILNDEGVEFGSFNVLTDNNVRLGVKKFLNWPTFPQLYCKGEFLGDCDMAVAMHESGQLKELFIKQGIQIISKENKA